MSEASAASTARLAELRSRRAALEQEVRKLESQHSLLEKRGDDERASEVEAKLTAAQDELLRVTDELEATEEARVVQAQTTDELERLIDSFEPVASGVPELAELLAAMKLCVGALATSRRLERKDESLREAKDISRALSEALLRLASTMSTRSQVLQVTGVRDRR